MIEQSSSILSTQVLTMPSRRKAIKTLLSLACIIISCDAFHALKLRTVVTKPIGKNKTRAGGGGGDSLTTSTATFAKFTPTDADVHLHQTLHQLGVRGVASHSNPRGVEVCTTSRSVAGRGAFWSPSSTGSEQKTAQRGDVLAYVPKSAILTLSNIDSMSPSGDTNNKDEALLLTNTFANLSAKSSWPVAFTLYVQTVAQQNEAFREWIESFIGPSPPIRPADSETAGDASENELIYNEAVQSLVSMAQVSEETAKEASVARYKSYTRDWSAAKEFMENTGNTSRCINIDESQFAKLYSILISRTANLGPTYKRDSESKNVLVRGVIPLHDMINHPPPLIEHNVELLTVGDVREMLPEETLQALVGAVFEHDNDLDDRDVLLIARREITPGDELFLSYRNNRANPMEEKERAWTTLQYGFLIQ
jgi:hypothetical protein